MQALQGSKGSQGLLARPRSNEGHCTAKHCSALHRRLQGREARRPPLAGSRVSGTAPFTSLSGHGLAAAVSSEPGQHSSICRNKLTTNGMKTDPRPPY